MAEEAFAHTLTNPNLPFLSDESVFRWGYKNNELCGTSIKDLQIKMHFGAGFLQNVTEIKEKEEEEGGEGGACYMSKSGLYYESNFKDLNNLHHAIAEGPVKNHMYVSKPFSSQIQSTYGWFINETSKPENPKALHAISLFGYGPIKILSKLLHVKLPEKYDNELGYLIFTWATIGIVHRDAFVNFSTNTYVRKPTKIIGKNNVFIDKICIEDIHKIGKDIIINFRCPKKKF